MHNTPFHLPIIPPEHALRRSHDERAYPVPAPGPGNGLLSPPLRFSEIANDASYVLIDDKGRVLCAHQQDKWDWAYLGDFDAFHQDMLYFAVSTARVGTETILRSTRRDKPWNFFVDPNGWLFASAQRWPDCPMLELHFTNMRPGSNQFILEFDFGSGPRALSAGNGPWDYLRIDTPEHAIRFTLHRYHMPGRKLADLISQTWPDVNTELLHEADRPYLGISAHHAEQIWNDSNLGRYQWREGSFDSDDFAFIYKAQASLDAYRGNLPHPYAVGWISGTNARHRLTANLFMDLNGKLNTLDPQSGEIIPAANWPFAPTQILI
ncbi:lectin MOA-related protein [Pseudomonas mosselii]|uniref:lectin MOA-related protein n=1 Tax=Pseudomonas mosselii TaxID=78327 RepID=UPI0012FDA7CF|nr:lectin MOA-related protein [Pseudomonas mosselii]UVN42731.1 lectin MOA-related protein [Pseudomonas mosselii]